MKTASNANLRGWRHMVTRQREVYLRDSALNFSNTNKHSYIEDNDEGNSEIKRINFHSPTHPRPSTSTAA
jgi:hypothetical protein